MEGRAQLETDFVLFRGPERLKVSFGELTGVKAEGGVYRAYVLMELPTGEAARRLMEQVKANEQLYTHFRSSEAFKELDAEVLRSSKGRPVRPKTALIVCCRFLRR